MSQESDLLEYSLIGREQSAFGGSFTYGTIKGPCSLSTVAFGGRLTSGGFSLGAEITIAIRKTAFGKTAPKVGNLISAIDSSGTSRALKIAKDGITDGVFFWEIICDDANQNA